VRSRLDQTCWRSRAGTGGGPVSGDSVYAGHHVGGQAESTPEVPETGTLETGIAFGPGLAGKPLLLNLADGGAGQIGDDDQSSRGGVGGHLVGHHLPEFVQ